MSNSARASAFVACISLCVCFAGCGSSGSKHAPAVSTGPSDAGNDAGKTAQPAIDSGQTDDDAGKAGADDLPFVMVVADTSGSMERLRGCKCSSTDCTECLPDCSAGETSEWIEQLEALTGTFKSGNCTALARTAANGATYDLDYALDYHRPPQTKQATDGVLDAYASSVHLGMATFDSVPTYVGGAVLLTEAAFDRVRSRGVDGQFSFAGATTSGMARRRFDGTYAGRFAYPGTTEIFSIDTGIRNDHATDGALLASFTKDVSDDIQTALLRTRPYGTSPLASSMDDLDHFFRTDSGSQAFHGKRYAVLVTGGAFDDDFRKFRCDCTKVKSDPNYCGDGEVFDNMGCPYPTPAQAAHILRCGYGTSCTTGTVTKVYVVGFLEAANRTALDAVAKAGGTDHFRAASSVSDLRVRLAEIFDEISKKTP